MMEFKLHNGSGGLCCKSCGRQDKQLNTYDWLADIPGNADESELVEVQQMPWAERLHRLQGIQNRTARQPFQLMPPA